MRKVEGAPEAKGLHMGVAVATFNQAITDRLLSGALEALEGMGASDVTVLVVPGALELPVAAGALARRGCHGVVALGAVVKGDTDHYEVVVRESAGGLGRVALDHGIPVTNGVLAVHTIEQAFERSEPGPGNKGAEAATAAVVMADALRRL